jgi:hypothetical protein
MIETNDERRIRLKNNYNRWLEKPGNKKKKYLSDKNTQSSRHRRWRQNHKDKTRLKSANERAYRLQRIPPWADMDAIKEFYLNCPEGYHVDHIIPLKGKNVSGLHVVENLQYLSIEENLTKGSKFEPIEIIINK